MSSIDFEEIRKDFPILQQKVHGKPLVYLDNAATTQKPRAVIDSLVRYYSESNSNVHRGIHSLSEKATKSFEGARDALREFLNAQDSREIIFVRGTTEAINLVAQTFGRMKIGKGDEIVISTMEHHSNIVPWQILCGQVGATLRIIPITDEGEIEFDGFEKLIGDRTKLVAIVHLSNSLGTINPIKKIVAHAHAHEPSIPVLVDGAQSSGHFQVDLQDLDCDFYTLSGHKIYGPTGIGVLYGKKKWLEQMPPYQGGGDMISSVTFEKTAYNDLPFKFEAGTPHISGVIALGEAVKYVNQIGLKAIVRREDDLLKYGTEALLRVPGLRLIGTAASKSSILSFVLEGIHPHDVGTVLDQEGIAIRTGHHCTQPLMQRFKVPATCRASLAFYNTNEEIDALVAGLKRAREVFDV